MLLLLAEIIHGGMSVLSTNWSQAPHPRRLRTKRLSLNRLQLYDHWPQHEFEECCSCRPEPFIHDNNSTCSSQLYTFSVTQCYVVSLYTGYPFSKALEFKDFQRPLRGLFKDLSKITMVIKHCTFQTRIIVFLIKKFNRTSNSLMPGFINME